MSSDIAKPWNLGGLGTNAHDWVLLAVGHQLSRGSIAVNICAGSSLRLPPFGRMGLVSCETYGAFILYPFPVKFCRSCHSPQVRVWSIEPGRNMKWWPVPWTHPTSVCSDPRPRPTKCSTDGPMEIADALSITPMPLKICPNPKRLLHFLFDPKLKIISNVVSQSFLFSLQTAEAFPHWRAGEYSKLKMWNPSFKYSKIFNCHYKWGKK